MHFKLGVISNKYIKGLIITLIYIYETNGQVDKIKEHVNPNASALQTQ